MRRLVVAAAIAAAGCKSLAPVRMAVGQPIPMGEHRLTITSVEMGSEGAQRQLIVHFNYDGPLGDLQGFLTHIKIALKDDAGKWYASLFSTPEDLYNYHKTLKTIDPDRASESDLAHLKDISDRIEQIENELNAGRNPGRWIRAFKVAEESRGFTLLVSNPYRVEGQARQIEVPLGR
ncbi:MAG: hypothetical protein ACRD96_12620 [Bryobacteraceae bacterium]